MPNKLDEAREQLARANRMIANEGVLDAFGHVTMRHPTDPERYLMSRYRAARNWSQPEDILEFDARFADREAGRNAALWRSASSMARSTSRGPR